jgi:hypothetical protein
MTDEVLDFFNAWTAELDADLLILRNDMTTGFALLNDELSTVRVEVVALGQQLGGLTPILCSPERDRRTQSPSRPH